MSFAVFFTPFCDFYFLIAVFCQHDFFPSSLNTDLFAALQIYSKQRIFVISHFKCPPPSAFCLCLCWEAFIGALLAGPSSLLPQSRSQMKNLWLYALKTLSSIWSAAFALMLPPLMTTVSAVFIWPVLFLTVGVQIRERGCYGADCFISFTDYSLVWSISSFLFHFFAML